ncbi:hypothetical protein LP421_15985 [Rhizobium sp. RCAM05350]|nr:hypothetical protein LP421_15985 [Rhizobium sp. RCAM05350]
MGCVHQSNYEKRYISIDLDGNVVVADTSAPDHAAKTWELLPEDIEIHQPGVPIAEKVRVTHKKIDDWLSRHEVERAHFLKSRGKSLPKSTVDRVSMIKALFGDLTKEDQARISIPLDILLKIIAQR